MLSYWDANKLRIGFENAFPTIFLVFGIFLGLTVLLSLVARSWLRGGIAAGFVALYVFFVPALVRQTGIPVLPAIMLHLASMLLLFWLYRKLPEDRRGLKDIVGRANAVCLLLLALNVFSSTGDQLGLERTRQAALDDVPVMSGAIDADGPDVWHIVLDRYASAEILRTRYDFDDGAFFDALRERGFGVEENRFANYQRTSHSLASTMNGVYLDTIAARMVDAQSDWVPLYRAMTDNAAIRLFNDLGYRTVFAGSWWDPTRTSPAATESIAVRARPQLANLVLANSALGFWLFVLDSSVFDVRADQCYRASKKFDLLRELAASDDRKYVFAHFLVPHPPFVLEADGSCVPLATARRRSRTENYVNQVRYANREVLSLVDAILGGPRDAIVVLHSDEGPWPDPYIGNEEGIGTDPVPVRWTDLDQGQLAEKMGIFIAYRTPGGTPPHGLPTSPIQIYPRILRDRFGSEAPIPDSRHFIFLGNDALYRFENVDRRLGVGGE